MRAWISMLSLLVIVAACLAAGESQYAPRPLTLAEARQIALENSPDLAAAQQRVVAAKAMLEQSGAAFWPQIRLSGTYSASDNPVQAFMMTLNQRAFDMGRANFNQPGTTDNLNAKVLAAYSLYNGGRDIANRKAARLGTQASQETLAAARNDLVFEVTRAWHNVNKARQFVRAAEAAVASMEANRKTAADRQEAGQALKSDVLDAEVRLAAARENLVQARNAVLLAETAFRFVLGVGETQNVTAAERVDTDPIVTTLPDTLDVSARPELRAAQHAVAIAEQQLAAAKGGYRPRVQAFASYDLDSGNARHFEDSWLAGVSVELDVFDGFLSRNKVAEARANLEVARQQLRKVELALQLEAKQAALQLAEAQARLDTTAKAVAQAEESLQITKERYAAGLALLTQLLDAETALTAARQRRAAAEADARIAAAALDKALGKKLE